MSRHLKRIAVPKTWKIKRKGPVFLLKPRPGPHSQEMALPLGVLLRDMLKYAATAAEVTKVLQNKEVLVDGVRRRNLHFPTGLFDVITIKSINKHYRMVLDHQGRLEVCEIAPAESQVKLGKITGKTLLPGGKIQYNLHDGKNIFSSAPAKVGDTLVLALPALEVKAVLPLQPGMMILLVKGKHSGESGELRKLTAKEAWYLSGSGESGESGEVGTARRYLFAGGEKKPAITINKVPSPCTKQLRVITITTDEND